MIKAENFKIEGKSIYIYLMMMMMMMMMMMTLCSLVKKIQTHDHDTICRKKKGVTCRFRVPWPQSERILIVLGGKEIDNHLLIKCRKVLDIFYFRLHKLVTRKT